MSITDTKIIYIARTLLSTDRPLALVTISDARGSS
jgi:xanthine/CO dehydrogenase XdhC/CoxF family maturation factor